VTSLYETLSDALRSERPAALAEVVEGPVEFLGRKLLVLPGPPSEIVGSLGNVDLDRVVARDDRVRGVILHPEMIAVRDRREQFEEHVLLLGELGIRPEAVLVMVLEAEHDVVLPRHREHAIDALDDPFQPLATVDLGIALAGEDSADGARPAQPPGDGD